MSTTFRLPNSARLKALVLGLLVIVGSAGRAEPRDVNMTAVFAAMKAETKKSLGEKQKDAADLRKRAAAGETEAQYQLGIEEIGKGGAAGMQKGLDWLMKAGDHGHLGAQNLLGFLYEDGHSINGSRIRKNHAESFRWYLMAAEQGDGDAQLIVGQGYSDGRGVPKDAPKASEWWLKAGAQGVPGAWNNLGWAYSHGHGVRKDRVLAYAWYNLAASSQALGATRAATARKSIVLTPAERAEAQRLSSSWKVGQVLTRESSVASSDNTTNGTPIKRGTGTLFVVSKMGHAVTNQHVANGCTELRIPARDEVAKLITEDAVNDLALVQVQGSGLDTAVIAAEPGKLRQGEDIVAFGFPLNSILSSGGNLTPGVVSALTGLGNNTHQIQITAPIQPGSSGSPLLNKKGEVVGVVSMKLSDAKMAMATGQIGQNVNFAVSGQTLKAFLDAHKVPYSTGGFFSREKDTADLADEARKWTVVVECWK